MKTLITPPDTCSTSEAARTLGVSVRTIQLWVEQGMLEAWKTPGGHRRILRHSIAQILTRQHDDTASGDRHLTILVIESNPQEREALGKVLGELFPDSKIRLSPNTFESLLNLGNDTPDVLIADIDELDLTALGTQQQPPRPAGPLLIALTANPAEMAGQCQQYLPTEFVLLGKPPSSDEMCGLIRAFRQGRQNHRRKA